MRWLPAIMVLASCAKGRVELGPVAQPFGTVDKVRFGMTVDEVKQATSTRRAACARISRSRAVKVDEQFMLTTISTEPQPM